LNAELRYRRTVQEVRAYPFDRWPKLTRNQLRVMRDLEALWDDTSRAEALQTARALLGADIALQIGRAELRNAGEVAAALKARGPCVGVLVDITAGNSDACLSLELSHACAEHLVDRCLGGDATEPPLASGLPIDQLALGALAYLCARVLGSLSSRLALRTLFIEPAALARALGDAPIVVWPLELQLGAERFQLRLHAPEAAAFALPTITRRPDPKRALETLPLTLLAEAGRCTLLSSALAALQLGDVIVLDQSGLQYQAGHFAGSVNLRVQGSRNHFTCRAHDHTFSVESLEIFKEPNMTTGRLSQAPEPRGLGATLAADAPLELSVELARFTLSLAELQRTQPGDVLVTGRRIGESVTLRAAGRVLAHGELVDVDGEIGVRILDFAQEG
jgi:type III secretion system YscQ/HrcQ family protein